MIGFAYPWLLFALLLLIPAAWWITFHRRAAIVTTSVRPFRAAAPRRRSRGSVWEWCIFTALALTLLALARPRFGDERVVIRAKGIDIVIALDLSGSMAAFDPGSDLANPTQAAEAIRKKQLLNRLEIAKREVRRFIEARPNDRIGLVGFANLAYSLVPPTLDHALLLQRLKDLQPTQLGDGTGIASALGIGITRLRKSDAPRRVLVLFTDGANNVRNRLTPEETARLARECQVIIHTVGIGSGNALFIAQTPFGSQLVPVRDSFDEALMKRIAETTGGTYFHAADAAGMQQVMSSINELEKTTLEQPRYMEYREYAPPLAALAALILLFGCIAEATFALRLP